MPKDLDIDHWKRRDHYHFFRRYERPFYNLCADVDVSALHDYAKQTGVSFFAASLYAALRAANEVEEFRYRVRPHGVIVHDVVHAGSTVLNDDETFSFCYFDFHPLFGEFSAGVQAVVEQHRRGGAALEPQDWRDDLIHFSVIPWISFTGLSHARRNDPADSVPKIVFGKYRIGDVLRMPVSVEVHHALMDALHVARFLDHFQRICDAPQSELSSRTEQDPGRHHRDSTFHR